jgi:hypothetical protein
MRTIGIRLAVLGLLAVRAGGQTQIAPRQISTAGATSGWVLTNDAGTAKWLAGGGGGGAVSSVFTRTGAVVAASGDYTTAQVTESGNLYFTNARARSAVSVSGGCGTYNGSTGVFDFTGCQAALTLPLTLANGGTGANLSATGGTGQLVKQTSVGGNLTVAALASEDLPAVSPTLGYVATVPFFGGGVTFSTVAASATLRAVRIQVASPTTIRTAVAHVGTTSAPDNFVAALYSGDGATLIANCAISTATTGAQKCTNFSPVTIYPGWYIFLYVSTSATPTTLVTNSSTAFANMFNAGTSGTVGTCAGALSGTTPPSTCTFTGSNQAIMAMAFVH